MLICKCNKSVNKRIIVARKLKAVTLSSPHETNEVIKMNAVIFADENKKFIATAMSECFP